MIVIARNVLWSPKDDPLVICTKHTQPTFTPYISNHGNRIIPDYMLGLISVLFDVSSFVVVVNVKDCSYIDTLSYLM